MPRWKLTSFPSSTTKIGWSKPGSWSDCVSEKKTKKPFLFRSRDERWRDKFAHEVKEDDRLESLVFSSRKRRHRQLQKRCRSTSSSSCSTPSLPRHRPPNIYDFNEEDEYKPTNVCGCLTVGGDRRRSNRSRPRILRRVLFHMDGELVFFVSL